jgi:stress response protein YsnF
LFSPGLQQKNHSLVPLSTRSLALTIISENREYDSKINKERQENGTVGVYEKVVGKQSKRWYPHLKEKNETERTPPNGNERKAQNSTASRDGKRVA